jgi:tetratricopeptide (TPR) repeat protein
VKALEDVIERFPSDSDRRERYLEVQGSLGSMLRYAGENEAAEQYFRRALEIEGRAGARIRRRFAKLLMAMNRYDDAERTLEQARRVFGQQDSPTLQGQLLDDFWMVQILTGLGELSYHLARSQQAEDHLRQAVDMGEMGLRATKSRPWTYHNLAWSYHHLGEALVQQGEIAEAGQAAGRARKMWEAANGKMDRHNAALASMRLGELRHHQGDTDGAREHFRRAKEDLDKIAHELPDEPYCQKRLIVLLAHCPDPDFRDPRRAVQIAQRVKTDSDGPLWRYLALSQYRAGVWEDARSSIEMSMKLRAGGDPLDWILLAMAQWQLGSHDAAVELYSRAEQAISSATPILYLEMGVLGFQRLRAEATNLLESSAASFSDLPFTGRLGMAPCTRKSLRPFSKLNSSQRVEFYAEPELDIQDMGRSSMMKLGSEAELSAGYLPKEDANTHEEGTTFQWSVAATPCLCSLSRRGRR